MFYDLYYYLVLPLVAMGASMGTWYIIYPDNAKSTLATVSWKTTLFCVECNELKNSILNRFENIATVDSEYESDFEDEPDKIEKSLLYNDTYGNNYITNKITAETLEKIKDFKPRIMFIRSKIGNEYYFKRTTDPLNTSECDAMFDKPFIQVEYVTKNGGVEKIVDIHSNLKGFYINGNTLLDYEFLNWFLPYYYEMNIEKEYELRVFDKDVNMFTLSSNQLIKIENNSYEIIDYDANE
jgi:hypothetical protein